jgi:flagella basal body P-ring formation protein FlgA
MRKPLRDAVLLLFFFVLCVIPSQGMSNPSGRREPLREDRTVELGEMTEILEQRLRERIGVKYQRLELKDVRCVDKITVPSGLHSWDVILPEQAGRGGPLTATLVLSVNGKEFRRVRMSARVDLYAEVVATSRYLKRHHEIQEDDVQLVSRNISLLPRDVVTDMEDVLNMRTTSSINGQEVLRKSLIQVPPLVKKGDRVMMLVENEQFKIITWGEVKEEGRKGDRIKMVNLSSRKEVLGRVMNAGTVMIEY